MKAIILFLLLLGVARAVPVWGPANLAPKSLIRYPVPVKNTGSMMPMLRGGEFLYYQPYTNGMELRRGNWLLMTFPWGAFGVHELTAQNKRAILTSGINNRNSDGWTLKDSGKIVGVVRFIVRPEPSPSSQVR